MYSVASLSTNNGKGGGEEEEEGSKNTRSVMIACASVIELVN